MFYFHFPNGRGEEEVLYGSKIKIYKNSFSPRPGTESASVYEFSLAYLSFNLRKTWIT